MDELLLTPEEIRAIRNKAYPWDEAIPMSPDLDELLDKTQAETAQAQLAKAKPIIEKAEREKIGFGFRQLQTEAKEWRHKNFPDGKPYHPFFGLVEELGELAHSHLKREQGIRMEENHIEKQKDAIGDIAVFLSDYCNMNGFDIEECVKTVWAEVKQRNWQALKEGK